MQSRFPVDVLHLLIFAFNQGSDTDNNEFDIYDEQN